MEIIRDLYGGPPPKPLLPRRVFGTMRTAVLDIETVGLSPAKSPCILCGIVKTWQDPAGTAGAMETIQLFAEDTSPAEERAMLEATEKILADIDVVITYNGASFDIPYLKARRQSLGLAPMAPRYNLDLYSWIKRCSDVKKFLPNLKQPTVEDFMGLWIDRTDTIHGGESVRLYYDYLSDRQKYGALSEVGREAKEKVLLHNHDDILQLARLTDILSRVDVQKALYTYGLPVKGVNPWVNGADLPGQNLFVVEKIEETHKTILAQGHMHPPQMETHHYGDEGPTWHWKEDGTFRLSIPTQEHKGITFVDGEDVTVPSAGGTLQPVLPSSSLESGYLVLGHEKKTIYENVVVLIQSVLEHIAVG